MHQTLHRVVAKEREEIERTTGQKTARWHNGEGGNHLDQESNRQTAMEDIDGGLHPAVDGQSLDDRRKTKFDTNGILTALYIVIVHTNAICVHMNIHETIILIHIYMSTHKHIHSHMYKYISTDIRTYGATRGVTVSTSAFLACHQCYCAGSSLGAWIFRL